MDATERLARILGTTVPAFFMREKPTSRRRNPACMNNTRTAAATTQTVSTAEATSLSDVAAASIGRVCAPAGGASFARGTGFARSALYGGRNALGGELPSLERRRRAQLGR